MVKQHFLSNEKFWQFKSPVVTLEFNEVNDNSSGSYCYYLG